MFTTSGRYPWSFVTQKFCNGQPCHDGDRKMFELMPLALSKETLGAVASLLAATLYQGNPDKSSGVSYYLRDKYSIFRCFWNVSTYKWKVHNGKIEIIFFVVKFGSEPSHTVDFEVYVKV